MNNKSQNCLICSSPRYREIFSYTGPDKYEEAVGVTGKDYFRKWVQCTNCDFYYSIYSRDENIMEKIYQEKYRNPDSSWRLEPTEDTFNKITNLPLEKSETKFKVRWIKRNIRELQEQGVLQLKNHFYKFLDIGGGNGIFVYEFRDKNWEPYIIDPSLDESFVKNRLNILFVKDFYCPNMFNTKFDLVSMVYLLEHLKDPRQLLNSVHEDMNTNALLYIEIPDAISFEKKSQNDDIFNSTHLYMFSPKSLIRLLDSCRFEVLALNRVKTKRDNYALMTLSFRQ